MFVDRNGYQWVRGVSHVTPNRDRRVDMATRLVSGPRSHLLSELCRTFDAAGGTALHFPLANVRFGWKADTQPTGRTAGMVSLLSAQCSSADASQRASEALSFTVTLLRPARSTN
jgi:hypothetical protein